MKRKIIRIPEHLILELLKGKEVTICNPPDTEFHLIPQTEGVFLTREEFMHLRNEASSCGAMARIMERLRQEDV